ncbi:MAG TPA: C45 family autoproteolytic acyltransferase/hydrolase [Verrucomicrobiota bacterium]|nr:C45 family autoproteolytic acyltransferase/hydrolase [Verrucomicrobiota bacterium]HNT15085.1 C45 family autoproteolytic acyltransferase/hydrolase [Verrucomicrobiota bacterium]
MKRFRIIALALGLLACGGWFSGKLLVRSWTQKPPPLPADTSILQASITTRGDKTWLGQSWLAEREGLTVIRLKGSPFAMGYASGRLLEKKMHTLEDEFLVMIHGYVPQSWKLHVLKTYVTFRNRHLSRFVPLDYRLQIFGTTRGCPDAHPELGDYYDRLLNYHAAHDISYMMIDNPLVSKAGCTAFGAWGNATADGHLITGRNFDWEAAEVFSRDRIVMLYEPDDGIPFVSLAWASMAGVVSGMNRAGVSITINGAPSSLPGETATPIALVAREVLQRARNLTNALEIIRTNRVFVSALLLVGSRADGKFVVVEKTPETTNVREAQGDTIVSANHFETGKLKDDERNLRYLAEGTSLTRYRRLNELLQAQHGHLTPERAAALLRDRHLPGGKFPGNGHRGTLNALIATHATIMDLTGGIFWAASPPHQLGKFVAFDVNDFERELPARTIPDDPMLGDGELEKFQTAQRALQEGQRALKNQQATEALAAAERAERNNPGFYQNAELRGRAWLRLGRTEEARQALETALAASPAFRSETEQLEKLLQSTRDAK